MKNILILHGSRGSPDRNWYRYLESKAIEKGYEVNIPQMNFIEGLDVEKTANEFIKKGLVNSETTIIGHSSGARVAIGILNNLPKNVIVQKTITVAGFSNYDLHEALFKVIPKKFYKRIFKVEWYWKKVRTNSKKFIFIYSDNDPYVPVKQAMILEDNLGGKLVCIKGAKHFSTNTNPKFKKFSEILEFI